MIIVKTPILQQKDLEKKIIYERHYKLGSLPLSTAINKIYAFLSSQPHISTILDLGCGAGRFALNAPKKRSWKVIGVDTNESALNNFRSEITKKNLPDVALHGDITKMEMVGEKIDAVIAWRVLHLFSLKEQQAICKKIHAILPKNGSFFISVASHEDWKVEELTKKKKYNHKEVNDCSDVMQIPYFYGVNFFSNNKLHSLGKTTGFQNTQIEKFEEPSGFEHLREIKPNNKYLFAEFVKSDSAIQIN